MRSLLIAIVSLVGVIAAVAAVYGLVRGNWTHALVELAVVAICALAVLLLRGRRSAEAPSR